MTDQNGQQTIYAYTDTGRLDTITAPGSRVWNFDYNSLGQKTQYTHPNGTRTEYGYDTRHRLTSIVHKDASNNTVLDSFTFTLDTEGNITQVQHADGSKWGYNYDTRHRVTLGTLTDPNNVVARLYGYSYDAANNLTGKTRAIASPSSYNSWVYAYDDANEQTSVTLNGGTPETRTYDAWGRMATRTQGTSSATFGYRYGGKLYSYATNFGGETAETMQYRGDGRLYSRTTATTAKLYRYDQGWNAINEEDGANNLTATSVYAPGADVGERLAYAYGTIANGVIAYAYHDQLGSTRAWRWWNKNLIGKDDFAPYGEPITTTTLAPIDYALHVQDPNTLLYHAAYREYSAGWARWTARDPLGMVDGPNEYGYVKARTNNRVDKLGLSDIPWPSNFDDIVRAAWVWEMLKDLLNRAIGRPCCREGNKPNADLQATKFFLEVTGCALKDTAMDYQLLLDLPSCGMCAEMKGGPACAVCAAAAGTIFGAHLLKCLEQVGCPLSY